MQGIKDYAIVFMADDTYQKLLEGLSLSQHVLGILNIEDWLSLLEDILQVQERINSLPPEDNLRSAIDEHLQVDELHAGGMSKGNPLCCVLETSLLFAVDANQWQVNALTDIMKKRC
jgi:hypothetical protein